MTELARQLPGESREHHLGSIALQLVATLAAGTVVLDPSDHVVLVNPAATALGVVRAGRLHDAALIALVRGVRADGSERSAEFVLPARPEPPLRRPRRDQLGTPVRVRVTCFASGHVAVVLDDLTEAHRVEAVRRDFVANVSHELKTPVGALSLLAEAISGASGDSTAVRRFAGRMEHEARRLSRLVQELIDLSRLQGAEAAPEPVAVDLYAVVSEAVDRVRLAAQAKRITVGITSDVDPAEPLVALGDEGQLVTAVANLLENAVAYSPDGTRVSLGLRSREGTLEISVADEGIGIAAGELERIFERFYRSDPARSRRTGGTGLGLAIVKHIASNHGGRVSVWSVEGAGSTFTLQLPAAPVGTP